jgi:hypothetical protein
MRAPVVQPVVASSPLDNHTSLPEHLLGTIAGFLPVTQRAEPGFAAALSIEEAC